MHTIRLTAGLTVLLLVTLPAGPQDKSDSPTVTLKTVKYAGLTDTIVKQRGKVVVVDLWGFF